MPDCSDVPNASIRSRRHLGLVPVACRARRHGRNIEAPTQGILHMDIVSTTDGRPRLLDLIDQSDGLRSAMDFDVIYSLADRPCQRCLEGRRESPGESIALVKRQNAAHPLGHLITLCAEHADLAEAR